MQPQELPAVTQIVEQTPISEQVEGVLQKFDYRRDSMRKSATSVGPGAPVSQYEQLHLPDVSSYSRGGDNKPNQKAQGHTWV